VLHYFFAILMIISVFFAGVKSTKTMIIFRYLAKEVYTTLVAVTGVLFLTFFSQQFARYLSRAAAGKFSGAIVLKVMLLQIPSLLGLLLPAGLYLGILLAYGRLYVDNEMTVLSACGFSKTQLVMKTLIFSVAVMCLVGLISLFVAPALRAYQAHVVQSSPAQMLLGTIAAGRFQVSPDGETIYYIEGINRQHNQVENIFVANEKKNDHNPSVPTWQVTSAKTGYQLDDEENGGRFIVAVDGFRYMGVPGEKNFRLVQFHEYGMRLDEHAPEVRVQHAMMTNRDLWGKKQDDKHAIAELQWRLVLPLSVPLLALLAVPLSCVQPRKGRYSRLLPAILLYMIYANMMYIAKDWVEEGTVSPVIGIWWLPGCLCVLACVLLWLGNRKSR
jgi:lipopolysaccharide export system permease protein